MDCLNLGCGHHFHSSWTNVDFVSTGEGVIAHNLRQGIPFADASFDVVYHSHILEHFPRAEAVTFLQECWRVLRPQGILRVVVPDLEQIARVYLTALEQASQGATEWADHYQWMLLELFDQVVRCQSGGEMAAYLANQQIPNAAFVVQRLGREAEILINWLQSHPLSALTATPSERDLRLQPLLGSADYQALQIGRFRQNGEVHQWMYDRYSLQVLLEANGYEQVCVCAAHESRIPEFAQFHLDTETDERVRKPDSLFVEAVKSATPPVALQSIAPQPEIIPPQDLSILDKIPDLEQQVAQLQAELTRSRSQLEATQQQLQATQQQLQASENSIAAMESSKFWQLRDNWFKFKKLIGLGKK